MQTAGWSSRPKKQKQNSDPLKDAKGTSRGAWHFEHVLLQSPPVCLPRAFTHKSRRVARLAYMHTVLINTCRMRSAEGCEHWGTETKRTMRLGMMHVTPGVRSFTAGFQPLDWKSCSNIHSCCRLLSRKRRLFPSLITALSPLTMTVRPGVRIAGGETDLLTERYYVRIRFRHEFLFDNTTCLDTITTKRYNKTE